MVQKHGKRRGVWMAILGWSAALAGAGCSGSRDGENARLNPSPKPYESDIPIPQGFKMVEQAMEDHSTGVSRTYLRHSYVGSEDKFAARNFYREQMPLNRWSMVSDSAIKGNFSMRFAKANESCVVTIEDARGGLGKKTSIQVMISPEKKGTTPPTARSGR